MSSGHSGQRQGDEGWRHILSPESELRPLSPANHPLSPSLSGPAPSLMGSAEEAGIMGSRTRIAGEMFKTVTQTGIRILEVGFGRSVLRKTTLGGNGSEDSGD